MLPLDVTLRPSAEVALAACTVPLISPLVGSTNSSTLALSALSDSNAAQVLVSRLFSILQPFIEAVAPTETDA